MAIKHFKKAFMGIQKQALEMKADLADFEQAFADGYITEDRLTEVKENINRLMENYNRWLNIAWLLELPNRKANTDRIKNSASNKSLLQYFEVNNATTDATLLENKSCLDTIRAELKKLKDENSNIKNTD